MELRKMMDLHPLDNQYALFPKYSRAMLAHTKPKSASKLYNKAVVSNSK